MSYKNKNKRYSLVSHIHTFLAELPLASFRTFLAIKGGASDLGALNRFSSFLEKQLKTFVK